MTKTTESEPIRPSPGICPICWRGPICYEYSIRQHGGCHPYLRVHGTHGTHGYDETCRFWNEAVEKVKALQSIGFKSAPAPKAHGYARCQCGGKVFASKNVNSQWRAVCLSCDEAGPFESTVRKAFIAWDAGRRAVVPVDAKPEAPSRPASDCRDVLAYHCGDDPLVSHVGGDHYSKMKIQPVEFCIANNIPFVEGSVIKYVCRWESKGGVEDLKKAKHLLEILIARTEDHAD